FATHLGDYLNGERPPSGVPQEIAATVLGLPRRVHAAIDHESPPAEEMPLDNLGMSSAYGHDFRLSYAAALLTNEAGREGFLDRFRADAWLIAIPGFLRPGTFSTNFSNGAFSELHLVLGWGTTGLDEVDFQTSATLVGHYTQRFERGDDGALAGR